MLCSCDSIEGRGRQERLGRTHTDDEGVYGVCVSLGGCKNEPSVVTMGWNQILMFGVSFHHLTAFVSTIF